MAQEEGRCCRRHVSPCRSDAQSLPHFALWDEGLRNLIPSLKRFIPTSSTPNGTVSTVYISGIFTVRRPTVGCRISNSSQVGWRIKWRKLEDAVRLSLREEGSIGCAWDATLKPQACLLARVGRRIRTLSFRPFMFLPLASRRLLVRRHTRLPLLRDVRVWGHSLQLGLQMLLGGGKRYAGATGWTQAIATASRLHQKCMSLMYTFLSQPRGFPSPVAVGRSSALFFAGTFCFAFLSSDAGRPVALGAPSSSSLRLLSQAGRKIDGTLEPIGPEALVGISRPVRYFRPLAHSLSFLTLRSQTAGHCAFRWNQAIAFRAD